jgi:hypothetical protein
MPAGKRMVGVAGVVHAGVRPPLLGSACAEHLGSAGRLRPTTHRGGSRSRPKLTTIKLAPGVRGPGPPPTLARNLRDPVEHAGRGAALIEVHLVDPLPRLRIAQDQAQLFSIQYPLALIRPRVAGQRLPADVLRSPGPGAFRTHERPPSRDNASNHYFSSSKKTAIYFHGGGLDLHPHETRGALFINGASGLSMGSPNIW